MTENYEEQTRQIIEQGKQAAASFIKGGEMIIDSDPENGFFRVKLRNIEPPEITPQVTSGYCLMLENFATMLNLRVKRYEEKRGE